MFKINKCPITLLGIIVIQFYFSLPIFAANIPIVQRNVVIAHVNNADYLSAQTALELFLTQHCFPAELRQPQMKPIFRACIENNCRTEFINAGEKKLEIAVDESAMNLLMSNAIAHAYFKNIPASLEKMHQLRTRFSSHEKFPEYLLNISIEYFAAGAQAESIQLAEEIVEEYPKCKIVPDAMTLLAINYFKMGSMSVSKQMLDQLRTCYSSHEKFPEYLFKVSQTWWTIKTRAESIRLAEEIIEKYPHHKVVPDTLNELAIRYLYVDKLSASKDALHQLRSQYSTHEKFPDYLVYISRWYWGEGAAKDESIQMVSEVLKQYPNHKAAPDAIKELIARYPYIGKQAEANQLLNQLRTRYSTHEKYPEYLMFISKNYWKANAKDESFKLLQEVVDKYPKHNTAPRALRGMITRYASMGKWTESVKKADQMLTHYLYSGQLPGIMKAVGRLYKRRAPDIETKNWLNNRLTKLVQDGQNPAIKKQGVKLCILLLDEQAAVETITGDSASVFVKNYSADELMELLSFCREKDKSSLAIKLCQKYLKGQPSGPGKQVIELQLYTNMFFSADDPMPLVPHLEDYIINSKNAYKNLTAQATILKGRIIMHSGNADDSIEIFKKAIDEYPDIPEVQEGYFLLGYCYLLQNEFENSKQTLKLFINKYPANINVSQAKKLIKRISELTVL